MEENSGEDQLYIPQVGADRKPKTGMVFVSLDEAFSFYNQYAREAGFSARMSNSKKNQRTNEVVWKKFVCFKEGHTDEMRWKNKHAIGDEQKKERARGEVRTGCKSKISLVKEQTGPNWIVSNFTESHNHPLSTPSKVHLLRSHRNVSAAKKALTQQFSEANVPTCQQMRLLEIEYGGPERVGCTERDIRNFENELKDEQKGIDAETLVEFFASEKEKNSVFFYDYETDSDNTFIRCFWADHVSKRAYNVFGDVVVFDTTYNTNKYGMIFAPFVGVNHHHQTIVFGCGFLSDEKTESFVWLFNKFIEGMRTGAPKVIITDQDPAMTKAIAQVFPQTVHRYCLWHILNKFPEKIDPLTFRDNYQSSGTPIGDAYVLKVRAERAIPLPQMEGGASSSRQPVDIGKATMPERLSHLTEWAVSVNSYLDVNSAKMNNLETMMYAQCVHFGMDVTQFPPPQPYPSLYRFPFEQPPPPPQQPQQPPPEFAEEHDDDDIFNI